MSDRHISEEEKIWRKHWKKKNTGEKTRWKKEWFDKGPIEFAIHVLKIDPKTGNPITLSPDQEEFLLDVAIREVNLSVISAGRGSGKTFAIAIYVAWRIFTNENYHISAMGGSAEQSDLIQKYIRGWIRNSDELYCMVMKDIKGEIEIFPNSSVNFLSCSGTSVRGEHVQDVIVDEEAAGEKAGGTEDIKAFIWQTSTSSNLHIIKSSTPHYVHGDFLETWNNFEKLGYKRYQWAVAKHKSGEKNPYLIFEDTIPSNWLTNVPWSNDKTIQKLRQGKSNEEWLVEALGAISMTSGLVFRPEDIDSCVCKECIGNAEGCQPYKEGYCPLVQYYMQLEGEHPDKIPTSIREALKHIGERDLGIDWGQVVSDCYTAIGRFREQVFILDHVELYGQTDEEKIKTADDMAKKWNIEIIRPDPEQWAYSNVLIDKGYAVHELFGFAGGEEKAEYLYTLKKFIERHKIIIPMAFESLIRSLKNLTYDKNGKIRKVDDHPFDSLLYAVSYYGEIDGGESSQVKVVESKDTKGALMWEKPKEGEAEKTAPEEDMKKKDFNPFDEKYLKKKREEEDYGEGGNIW